MFEFLLWGSKQFFLKKIIYNFFTKLEDSFEPPNVEPCLGGIFQKQDNEYPSPTKVGWIDFYTYDDVDIKIL